MAPKGATDTTPVEEAPPERVEMSLYGRDLTHKQLQDGWTPHEHYAGQDDTRIVKALLFPVHVEVHNPTNPSGPTIIQERLLRRGQEVKHEELGLLALEKGERLGAFFTDAELARLRGNFAPPGVTVAAMGAEGQVATAPNFSEWGEHELAEYLEQNRPTPEATIAIAGDDPALAQRVLEAEKIATGNDPREPVVQGLAAIVSRSGQ